MGAGTVHVGLTFSNGKSRQEARTPTRYLQLQTFSSACRIDEKGQEETSQRAAGTSVSPSQPPVLRPLFLPVFTLSRKRVSLPR